MPSSPSSPFDFALASSSSSRPPSKMPPLSLPDSDSLHPFAFASIQALLGHSKKPSSKPKRSRSLAKPPSDVKRHHHPSKRKGRKALNYLKPGALAQLRDAQRSARSSCCFKKKRIDEAKDEEEEMRLVPRIEAANQSQAPVEMTPGPSVRVFGPVCPQRKKLLAPKTPMSPAMAVPAASSAANEAAAEQVPSDSLLESLPLEILVRIVCNLHHDQLKPAFHVSKRVRQAVLIARQCHFDFTTPDRERQESLQLSTPRADLNWPFSRATEGGAGPSRPPTPMAPRPAPKPLQARISLAEMQQLAGPLFQGSTSRLRRVKPPTLPRVALRAVASHRVLFYEEELCQAVAQNSI